MIKMIVLVLFIMFVFYFVFLVRRGKDKKIWVKRVYLVFFLKFFKWGFMIY